MKVSYPLSLKISLWLLLNLLLLAGAGVVLYAWQFGRGWESLTVGALGERLQTVGDRIVMDLTARGIDQQDATLAEYGTRSGVELFLFLNEGRQAGGRAVELPEPLREQLDRGPHRSARRGPPREPFPPKKAEPMPGRGPLGEANRPPGLGRIVYRDAAQGETWIGLRMPLPSEDGPPLPGTLIIRAPSVLSILRFLELGPWFGIAIGAFALSVAFWLPLVTGITGALRRLTQATESIAEGRFETRVPENRRDELGHLGASVNRMAARLDTLVNGQKRFLGDIAHELGSPIGRLQVATEILEDRAPEALREQVRDVREEVQQMSSLVNELLAFTKAGLKPRNAELDVVELRSLIDDVLAREAAVGRVNLALAPDTPRACADRNLLGRALANLVRNALRYAGDAGPVMVSTYREDGDVSIVVEDHGPGVPQEALARLGEPFYRPESARTRETGGVGLGLAIVRSCVAACGGEVRFANRTPHGFRAEVQLKAAP